MFGDTEVAESAPAVLRSFLRLRPVSVGCCRRAYEPRRGVLPEFTDGGEGCFLLVCALSYTLL